MHARPEPATSVLPRVTDRPAAPPDDDGPGPGRPAWWRRWSRTLVGLLTVAVVFVAALRAPAAVRDFTRAFTDLEPDRLYWLAVAGAAVAGSFLCYAALQSVLLRAGGGRVRMRTLARLSVASSGLRALLPIGVVPSSGWLLGEYRKMGVASPVALYAVLASGYVSTVALLGLLLLGSAIAGIGQPAVLVASGLVLAVGSSSFVALVHHLGARRRIERACSGPLTGLAARVVRIATEIGHLRVGARLGSTGFAAAAGNWLGDLVCLVAAFAVLGFSVPWRGLLFAYTLSQLAGSLVPLPGGLGAVEGGLVGALDVFGVNLGAALAVAIVYRVVTYWGVVLVGGFELAVLSRHPPGPGELVREQPRARHGRAAP